MTFTRPLAYLSLFLVGCLIIMGAYADHMHSANAALQAEKDAISNALERAVANERKSTKALVARQAANAVQARKFKQAQEALSEALQRNKSWSDTDVPQDVQDGLAGAPGGLPERLPRAAPGSPGTPAD